MSNRPDKFVLEPFILDNTSLDVQCGAWPLPKSRIQVPHIAFSGVLGSKATIVEDSRFIRFRVGEIIDVVELGHGVVVDLRQVTIPEHGSKPDIIPSQLRLDNEPAMIVVSSVVSTQRFLSCQPNEITTDFDSAISTMAWMLRHHRFDRGRGQTAPPDRVPARLSPVSLDISSIQFKCYTLQPQPLNTVLGYIEFTGEYRQGSSGSDDARFIRWRLEQCCETIGPYGLIVDLRGLEYEWGDDLDLYPTRFPSQKDNIRFVVKPEQTTNFSAHIYQSNIRSDKERAFRDLITKAQGPA